MNHPTALWSTPWHARLKMQADALRAEGGVNSPAASKSLRARIAMSPAGSWLGRARSRAMPPHSASR